MLEGNVVRLRAVEETDLERVYTWINDREVTRYLAARYPASRADEQRWIASLRPGDPGSDLVLAIETKDGAHIGNLGLHEPRVEHRKATLGIVIGEKEYWSNGYGTDAIITILRFGFDEMNLNRVSLHVFDYNERGQACYRKCGFKEEARLRDNYYGEGSYHDVVVMGILRDEFHSLHGVSVGP